MESVKYIIGVAVLCLLLSGCSEVELHEPGQYQGKSDPLLKTAGTPEQEARLKERLQMVQTDR